MPVLSPTDELFTATQEAILTALGTARNAIPGIELPAVVRFDGPRASYYVSDTTAAGQLYGAVLVEGQEPRIGAFDRAELQTLQETGRLYRGDLQAALLTIEEVGRIASMRFRQT